MPTYEYECRVCQHKFEKVQAFGEEPVTTCPKCEGEVRKIISTPAVVFKGGKPSSERRTQRVGQRDIPIHQTEDGHWEQDGIRDKR